MTDSQSIAYVQPSSYYNLLAFDLKNKLKPKMILILHQEGKEQFSTFKNCIVTYVIEFLFIILYYEQNLICCS